MSADDRRIEVTAVINAAADLIFDYIARPTNHVTFDTSGFVVGCSDGSVITHVGAKFMMDMQNEIRGPHKVENHVICFEPGRAIGWAPAEPGKEPAGHTWTWRMTPIGPDQTLVTETYDWSAFRNTEMIDRLPVIGMRQMQESLARLAEATAKRGPHQLG
ncbi:hypothetical protein BTO20_08400 [Mycobacterium dioxanotrophicus]|uniref:Polyketide cyclase n=1 Tax=Mycobacterium dioxanotrophicus TaxID=482462 RepID=A0A1Y0C0B7_9MYCO|nr:SRPBCC family protein [Mycobacterium dioxanotrophicus]ART68598.1 hypothetical protein BTO20_08400 [Mycobacterium dioxanotrophicus]